MPSATMTEDQEIDIKATCLMSLALSSLKEDDAVYMNLEGIWSVNGMIDAIMQDHPVWIEFAYCLLTDLQKEAQDEDRGKDN